MSLALKKQESAAMRLPVKERARLAERLISSLDRLGDSERERLWLEEADRRYRDYKSGKIPSKSAESVFKNAYKKYK
jgi:putative addiction module component (TIGR02574 family)